MTASQFMHLALIITAIYLVCKQTGEAVPSADPDYADALNKAILFFEGQRSGRLDSSTLRARWRNDSGLKDGLAQNVSHLTYSNLAYCECAPRDLWQKA